MWAQLPPYPPPITFQLITVSQASPQDVRARWLVCHSELLGSICNLSSLSSFLLFSQSLTLVSIPSPSVLTCSPGLFFCVLNITPHFIHLFIFPPMIALSVLNRTVQIYSMCVWFPERTQGSAKRFSPAEMTCNFKNCHPAPHFKWDGRQHTALSIRAACFHYNLIPRAISHRTRTRTHTFISFISSPFLL